MIGEIVYSPIEIMSPSSLGLLLCDGSSYLKSSYADLFNFIGITFGGDSTHFNVPDYRGYFLRCLDLSSGRDTGRTLSEQFSQNKEHVHSGTTGNESQSHHHSIPIRSSSPSSSLMTAASGGSLVTTYNTNDCSVNHVHYFSTNSSGGSEARPINFPVVAYIRFEEVGLVTNKSLGDALGEDVVCKNEDGSYDFNKMFKMSEDENGNIFWLTEQLKYSMPSGFYYTH